MSAFSQAAQDYLALRRSLGHKLADAARLLPRFVAYLDQSGAQTVTVEAALAWAQGQQAGPGSTVWARRLTIARGFAQRFQPLPRTGGQVLAVRAGVDHARTGARQCHCRHATPRSRRPQRPT